MGFKCCVPLCKSNYKTSDTKVSIYRFPVDIDEKKRWIKAIPRSNLVVNKNTVVCRLHWPVDFKTCTYRGKIRPSEPPSVFNEICKSCISIPPKPRKTNNSSTVNTRNVLPDQLQEFRKIDSLNFSDIIYKLSTNKELVLYNDGCSIVIQSIQFTNGIPKYVLRVKEDLSFQAFHLGSSCSISTIATNKITKCETWSILNEILRYLENFSISHKKKIVLEQLQSMATRTVGKSVYSTDVIIRSFEYFATSRTLYSQLAKDYQLPSVRTLTRITSKVSKKDDLSFLKDVLFKINEYQRKCIIMLDEVYVKSALLYHGGTLFGRSVNHPDQLAKTVLAFMVKCLFGGPEFITKMLPVTKLNADFQHSQCVPIIENMSDLRV